MMAHSVSIPIRLETNGIFLGSFLLVDTKIVWGDDILIHDADPLRQELKRLDMVRLTLDGYNRTLTNIRARYPLEVKCKITEFDWERILKHFDNDREEAKKWVEDFVEISKGETYVRA